MRKQLPFRISSELKNVIGKNLITDDFIAIYELVKNAYDANARKVELYFNQVKDQPDKGKIFVKDDGDGMSYSDLLNKWLFVAYSEKVPERKTVREQENESTRQQAMKNADSRNKIKSGRIFAGAKGIGRFSCDKLGSKLKLYTKKKGEGRFHVLEMDWDKFEEDPTKEFQEVNVSYHTVDKLNLEDDEIETKGFEKGTILEISSLRSAWDAKKLLDLKRHLQRLINPAQVSEEKGFSIYLIAKEFRKDDREKKEDFDRINVLVRNILFERLQIKTTHISCYVDSNKIHTKLVDKGTFVYSIIEKNEYTPLHDVRIELFFLNKSAKQTFTNVMGVRIVNYGSVFFYKNGIKINPCGDLGDDWLGLDKRKAQGTRRNLGNRDILGRIEVSGIQPYFIEVSSRDGGVVKTEELQKLKDLFKKKALERLEKFVVEGIDWDSEKSDKSPEEIKADTFKIISQLLGPSKDSPVEIEFNKDLFEIYAKKQLEKTPELIENIQAVRKYVTTREARAYLDLQVKAVGSAFRELRNTQRELEKEIAEKEKHALFLERVAADTDQSKMMMLDHQIEIDTGIIKEHTNNLKDMMAKGNPISNDYLQSLVDVVLFYCKMLMSITKIVRKANIDLLPQSITSDLVLFIRQYLERVYVPSNDNAAREGRVKVTVESQNNAKFAYQFDPFKFIVVLDNLIDNSIKAKAKNVNVRIDVPDEKTLELHVIDDGVGIPDKDLSRIFSFGFSTAGGSGLGLYHVRSVLKDYGSITVNNKLEKGVEFIVRVKK